MRDIFLNDVELYYDTGSISLVLGDMLSVLKNIKSSSIDMIFADPPYFLSSGGSTCKSGAWASVNKGEWDRQMSFSEKHRFNREWLRACKRVLSNNGTIWISGTLHNIYSVGTALEEEGFKIINNITWQKTNPPPNLGCRCFTHSTETILWAKKDIKSAKHTFNYDLMKSINLGKQMKDVWSCASTPNREKFEGKHPTQKPEYILDLIVKASTNLGDLILDPFCGSSTTGVVAKKLGRRYLGIDIEKEYIDLSMRRLEKIDEE